MIRRPPRSTQSRSSAASDVYKRQGSDRVVSARPVVLGEPQVVEIHGALGHHRLVRFQIQTLVLSVSNLVTCLECGSGMGSHLPRYVLLSLSFHHVVEGEVCRRVSWIEDCNVLVELRQGIAFSKVPLGVGSGGTYGVVSTRPGAVVVEVHRALGHEVGAIGQDLE